jgi:subtilisin family serine protease
MESRKNHTAIEFLETQQPWVCRTGAVLVLLTTGVLGQSAGAPHKDVRPFYYYGNQRIYLKQAISTVAAKVNPRVPLQQRFPRLEKYFEMIAPSAISPPRQVIVSKPSVPATVATEAMSGAESTSEVSSLPVFSYGKLKLVLQNEIIVRFKTDTPRVRREQLLRKFTTSYKELASGTGIYVISLGNPDATLEVSQVLHNNHTVASSEPNFIVLSQGIPGQAVRWIAPEVPLPMSGPLSPPFPADPLFRRQWALENRIQQDAYGKEKSDIRIRGAWDVTQGAESVRVAVLDDGVDVNHPDLQNAFIRVDGNVLAYDAINDSPQQQLTKNDFHGTRVAGVIAAAINNQVGLAGVAPNTKLIPIRMGSHSLGREWTSPALFSSAIRKAVELNADVINCSFYLQPSDSTTADVQYALKNGRQGKGMLFVFAAGDSGSMTYPATLAGNLPVIAVGATNSWDQVKTSKTADGELWDSGMGNGLTVVAPGVGIVTTDVAARCPNVQGNYACDFDGTSSSAPYVAGVVALMLSLPTYHDALTTEIIDQITRTADKIDGPARTDRAGWGRINACRAVGGTQCD